MMTDNRATDTLRKLLDERGVEWEPIDGKHICFTEWHTHSGAFVYTARESFRSYGDHMLRVETCGLPKSCLIATPEQAIAATLGSGTLTANEVLNAVYKHGARWQAIADELNTTLASEVNGDTSDGYHTFNELYHHRAVLFSVVVAANSSKAWKSKLHHDGTMYDGMFIVGVDTPQGQATYHYDVEPYWDMFWCRELERAPEWDGHTPDDAIERIGSLRDVAFKGPRGRR